MTYNIAKHFFCQPHTLIVREVSLEVSFCDFGEI